MPLHLPNYAPIHVAREVWHSPVGPLDVVISYTGSAYEARATWRGGKAYILLSVPVAELREKMALLRAWARRGVRVQGQAWRGLDIMGADGDEAGGIWGDIVSVAKKVLNRRTLDVATKLASSPLGQAALLPILGPAAAGVGPMLSTVSQAAQLYDATKSMVPAKAAKAAAKVKSIQRKAAAGQPSARAALGALRAVAQAKKAGGHSVDAIERLPAETREWLAIEAQRGAMALDQSPVMEIQPPDDDEAGAMALHRFPALFGDARPDQAPRPCRCNAATHGIQVAPPAAPRLLGPGVPALF